MTDHSTRASTWPTLVDLWPAVIGGPAFLSTYTFDAPFFEMRLLPELLRRKAHPVVVLADRHEGYAAALRALSLLDGAGRDYHLIPVDVSDRGGCFHPKVHAFPASRCVLVGSGNLSPGGSGRNLEAFDRLENEAAVGAALNFISRVTDLPGAGVDPEDLRLFAAMLQAPELDQGDDVRFIHTLDGPLGTQLRPLVGDLPLESALLAAPFHDEDHRSSLDALLMLRPKQANVIAEAAQPWCSGARW